MELEDFATSSSSARDIEPDTAAQSLAERAKAEGYEEGYKAGWDDAVGAEAEKQDRVGEEFARNLQEISFTFHEARGQIVKSFEPFLKEVFEKILPQIAKETMAPIVLEELLPLIDEMSDAPIAITVAEGTRTPIERILTEASLTSFEVVEEPTLLPGQAFLRVGSKETNIDLARILARVGKAITALQTLNEKALKYG